MSVYKYILIIPLLGFIIHVSAQDANSHATFDEHVDRIAEKLSKLGDTFAEKIESIDTKEIERSAEKIARISEQKAEQLAAQFDANIWEEEAAYQSNSDQARTIQKVYIISRNTPLQIDNRFGSVAVKTWQKNEINVAITIRATQATGDRAAEIIRHVSIIESKSPSQISLTTQIDKEQSSWWNNLVNTKKHGVQINYLVYLPASNDLTISNKYGSVSLPDLNGRIRLDVSYGSLKTGKLMGPQANINSSYGSATIGGANDADLAIKYGSLALGEVNKLRLDIGYCGNSRIDYINQSGDIAIRYSGGFHVGLNQGIHTFNMDAAYSSSDILIHPEARFDYEVNVGYGGFDRGASTVTHEEPDPDSRGPKLHKSFQGYFGKAGSGNQVRIDAKYGSVNFE